MVSKSSLFLGNFKKDQEDSLLISRGAVERGLYNGCKFTFYSTIIEDKEKIGIPHIEKTRGLDNKNYSKLVDGIAKVGTIIKKNDVLISKYYELLKVNDYDEKHLYDDMSIVYKEKEPCIVHDVIRAKNKDSREIIKVIVRKLRSIEVGDKFCIKPDAQILTADGWIKIKDIDIKKNMVITMNNEHNIYYEYASNKYEFDCKNDLLYTLENEDLHIVCTLNHKLYVNQNGELTKDGNKYYSFTEAKNVMGKNIRFKKNGNSKIKDLPDVNLDGIMLFIEYNKKTPNILWFLSQKQSQELIHKLVDRNVVNNKKNIYQTTNLAMANDMTRLALHAGYSAKISKYVKQKDDNINPMIDEKSVDIFNVEFCFDENEPMINYKTIYGKSKNVEKLVNYSGKVMCIEVPKTQLFYYRESTFDPPCWIGNSSRMGQKGVCARIMDDADMPFTEDGIIPSIIMSPHSIPTRMTMGQLIENLTGNLCAYKGSHVDATIFRKKDIGAIIKELEDLGFNKFGYRKLYSGFTGEPIESLIFMGPTYYQRLHKFVKDTVYSRIRGPTNPITLQPLIGKSLEGGLRMGEMEKDILTGHGVSRFLTEKLFHHSDKFTEYICRCGTPAIVSEKGKYEIYKCPYCGDKADIVKVPTSWTCKLFVQYLEAMNIGVRRFIEPYSFEKFVKNDK